MTAERRTGRSSDARVDEAPGVELLEKTDVLLGGRQHEVNHATRRRPIPISNARARRPVAGLRVDQSTDGSVRGDGLCEGIATGLRDRWVVAERRLGSLKWDQCDWEVVPGCFCDGQLRGIKARRYAGKVGTRAKAQKVRPRLFGVHVHPAEATHAVGWGSVGNAAVGL